MCANFNVTSAFNFTWPFTDKKYVFCMIFTIVTFFVRAKTPVFAAALDIVQMDVVTTLDIPFQSASPVMMAKLGVS